MTNADENCDNSSGRGAKNERAGVRRKGKRAINEKQDHEIWIRKIGE
jgi:hypothetical protein